jgi:hypothetical protein
MQAVLQRRTDVDTSEVVAIFELVKGKVKVTYGADAPVARRIMATGIMGAKAPEKVMPSQGELFLRTMPEEFKGPGMLAKFIP